MVGTEFAECRKDWSAGRRCKGTAELSLRPRQIGFGSRDARGCGRADRLGAEALQDRLFDTFRFQFEALYLTAKGFANRAGNVTDARLQGPAEIAQTFDDLLAPSRDARIETRDIAGIYLSLVFGEKQQKQQEIHV